MDAPAPAKDPASPIRLALLLGAIPVALHLAWSGLTVTRTLMNFTEARLPLPIQGFDRAALVTHVHASWIALAVVLNSAWLLLRGFRVAGPISIAAGMVMLFLYFGRTLWQYWFAGMPGCLTLPLVAAYGLFQIGAPLSPLWPRAELQRSLRALDFPLLLILTAIPLLLGQMVLASAEAAMILALEEDPKIILAELDEEAALERAEVLCERRPEVARTLLEHLSGSGSDGIRARSWRLLGAPALGVPTSALVRALDAEKELRVRFALLEDLRGRTDADASAALARAARAESSDDLAVLARALSTSDPALHAALRIDLAGRVTGSWLAGKLSTEDFRSAFARAGEPELAGIVAGLEAAPAGALAPDGAAEKAVRDLWLNAARKGPESARAGLPQGRRLAPRLEAMVIGDLTKLVGRERFTPRWKFLAGLLHDGDAATREAAGYALYRLRVQESAGAITLALADENAAVRMWAAMTWTEMNGTPPAGTFETIFADEKNPDRYDAAVFLLRYGHDSAVVPYLIEQVRAGGQVAAMTRGVLRDALGNDPGPDADAWLEWWEKNRSRFEKRK